MLGLGLSACTTTQPTPVDGNFAVETGFGGLALRSPDEPTRLELAGARLRLRARGVGVAAG